MKKHSGKLIKRWIAVGADYSGGWFLSDQNYRRMLFKTKKEALGAMIPSKGDTAIQIQFRLPARRK